MALSSCSKEEKLGEILTTVPKDTKGLMLFNVKSLTEKLTDGKSENIGEVLSDLIGKKNMDEKVEKLFSKDSPIDFNSPAVFFEMKNQPFLTFYVKDEEAFRNYMAKEADKKLKDRNGIWVSEDDEIYMIGRQIWLNLARDEYVKASDFSKLQEQKEENSAMSIPAVAKLASQASDIAGFVNLKELDGLNSDFDKFMVGFNIAFDDPAYVIGSMNFGDGEIVSEATILNKDGVVAKCSIPLKKIDMNQINSFTAKGDMFFAFGLDPQLVDMVVKQMPSDIKENPVAQTIKKIDGTIIASIDMTTVSESIPCGALTIPFKSSNDAKMIYNEYYEEFKDEIEDEDIQYNVECSGNTITITLGIPTGVSIKDFASDFNDSYIGISFISKNIPNVGVFSKYISSGSYSLKPDGEGIKMEAKVKTKDGQNSLKTICELIKMAQTMR